jgi:hypothetical protein
MHVTLPVPPQQIVLFIAHLNNIGLQYSTIRSYISAISFTHRLAHSPDPTTSLVVTKTLQGLQNINKDIPSNSLLPITKPLLHRLIDILPLATSSPYTQVLMKSLFLLTYYACLRAGEAVISATDSHTINLEQISRLQEAYSISFTSYKHSNHNMPKIILSKQPTPKYCPVVALDQYLNLRSTSPGHLFLSESALPLTRNAFSLYLKSCLSMLGIPPHSYNTHSFRIGRATQLFQDNVPLQIIKSAGRWKSTAFLKYIRPSKFMMPS